MKPSNAAKRLYPRGVELEEIEDIPAKYKMPTHTFDMISDARKEHLANLMQSSGNTESPLYKLCRLQLKNDTSNKQNEEKLPDWIKTFLFKETSDDEIPYRVTNYSYIFSCFWL